jgi:hypothetical protein
VYLILTATLFINWKDNWKCYLDTH